MADAVVAVLLVAGSGLMFVAALGILRMPDLFTRMQATTKAATLGVGLLLAAAAVEFGELAVTTRVIAAAVFIAMTAPVAAHLLGRAAYFLGVPLWEGSVRDELRGRYNERAHALASMQELLGEERLAPGRATRRGADAPIADQGTPPAT
ncbi:monovalent cation/H(+) antiporter subunit G [Tepidiforma thermophila]|uniref:Multicomponent Na+:H+ antiporter subunit G n=1 Tax=Tepidiforma thermophila (strain KCTC 52669 / CGMCC 1.13589 / G233) TaxID=2761530 RepID=A0A2A9HEV8_TEPT2|nr:monovalent cation/H(+) antiporter subunit G [Tepidiforma thermophila]PFG73883.1 multicomponent Na+:H+ antiporter subunit G [Tepidiforma thermophila]